MNTTAVQKPDTSLEHFHGSDMEKIKKLYGIEPGDIISFSANVNPLGLPGKLKEILPSQLDVLTSYPDRQYTALRQIIADYCGAVSAHVAVGNGSSELISLYIRSLSPKKVLILGPTYSEYGNEAESAGAEVKYFEMREADAFIPDTGRLLSLLTDDIDLLMICNPNNPTSVAIDSCELSRILSECRKHGIFVLIDETYIEFTPDPGSVTAIPFCRDHDNLAVLRGVSKFFSAPGLRLGYSICSNDMIREKVLSRQVPWSINSLAEAAGRLMFSDEDFKKKTRDLITEERQKMYDLFSSLDSLKVYRPAANFILVKILKKSLTAGMVFDAAIRKGLMIRDCSSFPFLDESFFRFCIMKPEDNLRLYECIKGLL